MKLYELFLFETTEEDRAIISLASEMSNYFRKFDGMDHSLDIGQIGEIFDTPLEILQSVNIELKTNADIISKIHQENPNAEIKENYEIAALWNPNTKTVIFDINYIGTYNMKSIIAHELRHALDDFKSNFKAGISKKYSTPKDKANRKITDDPYFGNTAYLAEPAEINARFLEVMNQGVIFIRKTIKSPSDDIKPAIIRSFKKVYVIKE